MREDWLVGTEPQHVELFIDNEKTIVWLRVCICTKEWILSDTKGVDWKSWEKLGVY